MSEFDNKIKDYYTQLQNELCDFRDNRGKKHDLAFVMLTFMYSILRSTGMLSYSQIHRIMKRETKYLKRKIGQKSGNCISYSQLKRILASVGYHKLNEINSKYFGKTVRKDGLNWEALDGKELRGTIDKALGEKRSENIVQQVNHHSKESFAIGFYNGSKESEKTVVKTFFKEQKSLKGNAFSLDALHTAEKSENFVNT